jgi:tape measure domain-containing protein
VANSIAKLAILLTTDTSGMQRGFSQARAQVQQFSGSLSASGLLSLGSKGGLLGLAAAGAIGLAAGVAKTAHWATRLAEESKVASINFRTMIGDVAQADRLLDGIGDFSLNSSFSRGELQQAAQTMLAFGVSVERVMPSLRAIGDIALGDSEKMQRLSLAFAQTQAAGRLMGQDLLQMVNAGFNPLQEIARVTGRDMNELRQQMQDTGISAQVVAAAFKSATEEGGRFHQAVQALEGTMRGQWSKLKENIGEIVKPGGSFIGDVLFHVLRGTNIGMEIATNGAEAYALKLQRTAKAASDAADEVRRLMGEAGKELPKGDFLFNIDRMRAAQDAVAAMGKNGADFAARFRTPAQEFTAAVAEAAELLRDGGISAQVYERAIAKAKEDLMQSKDFAKQIEESQKRFELRENKALARGSAEAFQELMRIEQQSAFEREKAEIEKQQLEAAEKANAIAEDIREAVQRGEKIKIKEVTF